MTASKGVRFLINFVCLAIVSGCIIIPYETIPTCGTEKYELESLDFSIMRGPSQSVQPSSGYAGFKWTMAVSLSAACVQTRAGEPVTVNKFSFGLYPGYELHEKIEGPTAYAIASPIVSCVCLGIPVVDALLFEPFLNPTDGENAIRTWSFVGCCKYTLPQRKYEKIFDYEIEIEGKRYLSNSEGVVIVPLDKVYLANQIYKVKLVSAKVPLGHQELNGITAAVGLEFDAKSL